MKCFVKQRGEVRGKTGGTVLVHQYVSVSTTGILWFLNGETVLLTLFLVSPMKMHTICDHGENRRLESKK